MATRIMVAWGHSPVLPGFTCRLGLQVISLFSFHKVTTMMWTLSAGDPFPPSLTVVIRGLPVTVNIMGCLLHLIVAPIHNPAVPISTHGEIWWIAAIPHQQLKPVTF